MENEVNFRKNLQELRKKAGLSQEGLAEKMGVSRQSVSKWESGEAYPEMKMLLSLCEFFSVSLDTLVHGKAAEPVSRPTSSKKKYDDLFSQHALFVGVGVGIILFGVMLLMLVMAIMGDVDRSPIFGTAALIVCVAVAVILFVISGNKVDEFRKNNPELPAELYSPEETEKNVQHFQAEIAFSIGFIILGVAAFLATNAIDPGAMWTFVMLFGFLAVAITLLIYGGIQKDKYDIAKYNGENSAETKQLEEKIGVVSGAIMLVATMIYLIYGFVDKAWDKMWFVFPVGGVLCGLVSVIMHGASQTRK